MEVCWDDARSELVGARLRANEASKRHPVTRPNDQLLEPDTMAPSAPITVDAFPSDRGFLWGLSLSEPLSEHAKFSTKKGSNLRAI